MIPLVYNHQTFTKNDEDFLKIQKWNIDTDMYVDEDDPLSFQINVSFRFRINQELLKEEYEKIKGHYEFGEKDVAEFVHWARIEILRYLQVGNGEADNYAELARLFHVKRGGTIGRTFGL